MSGVVLIDTVNEKENGSWHKVKKDVTLVCTDLGFRSIAWHNQKHFVFLRIPDALLGIGKMRKMMGDKEWLILQYPHHPWIVDMYINAFSRIKKQRKCKLIILIHDVCYLRKTRYPVSQIKDMRKYEVSVFNQADAVIVHNDSMRNALIDAGVTAPMYTLGFFDYCCKMDIKNSCYEGGDTTVVYAGALNKDKCGFIYDCPELSNTTINLYGTSPDDVKPYFIYKGSFQPEELVSLLEGHYGLIWDGPSAKSCKGNYGEYLRYNSPHKFSLYLAAGLPVVAWRESAIAPIIISEGIGVLITSLEELNYLPNPNTEEYRKMVKNVSLIQKRIRSGDMLNSVIKQILLENS